MTHTHPDPASPYTLAPTLLFSPVISTSTAPVLFEMDSSEAVFFLTPVIGPTLVCLMHVLTAWCRAHQGGQFEVQLPDLSAALGVSSTTLRNTLERLRRFNFLHPHGGTPLRSEVLTELRIYPVRWLAQLTPAARSTLIDWQRTLGAVVG